LCDLCHTCNRRQIDNVRHFCARTRDIRVVHLRSKFVALRA
jgi:hypothetical protein